MDPHRAPPRSGKRPATVSAVGASVCGSRDGLSPQNIAAGPPRRGSITWAEAEAISGGRDGTFDAPCPLCSEARSTPAHRAAKVLKVWRDGSFASYCCAHCGARGWAPEERRPRPFLRPRKQAVIDPERLVQARAQRADHHAFAEFVFIRRGAAARLAGGGIPARARPGRRRRRPAVRPARPIRLCRRRQDRRGDGGGCP